MTKVWSIYIRIYHLILMISILGAFLSEDSLFLHTLFGLIAIATTLFRIAYGFMNIRYSRFRDFIYTKDEIIEFITEHRKAFTKHNPLASIVMLSMFAFIILTALSGVLLLGVEENKGIFSFLNGSMYNLSHSIEELHEFCSNTLMALIFIHLLGVFLDNFVHKNDSLKSMVTGFKKVQDESIVESGLHKFFGSLSIVLIVLFIAYFVVNQKNIFIKSGFTPIDYRAENREFVNECGSCHTLYPPYLLPKKSWIEMMDNLNDHFGDDASIDLNQTKTIKEYLVENSAEHSSHKESQKILKTYRGEIAITKNSYWNRVHKELSDDEVFLRESIKHKSNCKACHQDIEKGIIDDNIKVPKS